MANGVHFPEEIMLNIQKRLPVKSIMRFKSVCKPWLSLFSSPQFIKLHRSQFSSDPKNQTVIFHENYGNHMSLLNIESCTELKPTIIECPRLKNSGGEFLGCYNGLVCFSFLAEGPWPSYGVVIWNPATKSSKCVSLKRPLSLTPIQDISLWFGYDAEGDDFKLVRIFYSEEFTFDDEGDIFGELEVYSFNSESWVSVSVSFRIDFSSVGNEIHVIVNGNPYLALDVDGKVVLVCCDVTKLVCKIVPLPTFYVKGKVKFVDLNGALGALVCADENEKVFKSLDVWVFDDVVNIWRKTHTFDPIKGDVDMYLQRLKNGNLIGERPDGKLFVFDPDAGSVEEILMDVAKRGALQVHGYVESLATIEGMQCIEGMEVEFVFEANPFFFN